MKNILPLLFGAALLPLVANAQSYSNVVGYETLDNAVGFNFVGVRLHEPTVVAGSLEAVTATTATDNDVDFTAVLGTSGASGTYILEILDGTGVIQEVTTWTATVLDVADLSGVTAPVNYAIRPVSTVASVLGASNEAGLAAGAGGSGGADQVWLWNGTGFDKYYYDLFAPPDYSGPAWVNLATDTQVDPATIKLVYSDGFVISSASGNDVVVAGEVKPGETELTLTGGFNFVGSVAPVGATMATAFGAANEAGLSTGAGGSGGADQVWLWNGTGFDKFYYDLFAPPDYSGPAWVDVATDTQVDPATIGLDAGYVISAASAKAVTQGVPAYYGSL